MITKRLEILIELLSGAVRQSVFSAQIWAQFGESFRHQVTGQRVQLLDIYLQGPGEALQVLGARRLNLAGLQPGQGGRRQTAFLG